jgi:adenylate cyclase
MIIFGAPEHDPDHRFNAIGCAVMIQQLVERLNTQRINSGKYPIYFRIGVNSGPMLAGNMGSQDRMQYTVVGDAVNLAARLHTVAEKGQIVISEPLYMSPNVYNRITAKRHGSINLRGKTDPVTTYLVRDVAKEEREKMEAYLNDLLANRIVA